MYFVITNSAIIMRGQIQKFVSIQIFGYAIWEKCSSNSKHFDSVNEKKF
jgi:hypothetical protein